jgi:hypothetical protein
MDVNIGKYVPASLPVINIAAAKIRPVAENAIWTKNNWLLEDMTDMIINVKNCVSLCTFSSL